EQLPGCALPRDVTELGWYRLGGRESAEQAAGRAESCAARLRALAASCAERPTGTVALLSHHDFLSLLLRALLLTRGGGGFPHANTGMTCVDVGLDGRCAVVFQNFSGHLRGGRAAAEGGAPPGPAQTPGAPRL
ncbi:unnamed protein product, partial [Prorocentrum cordatum]